MERFSLNKNPRTKNIILVDKEKGEILNINAAITRYFEKEGTPGLLDIYEISNINIDGIYPVITVYLRKKEDWSDRMQKKINHLHLFQFLENN